MKLLQINTTTCDGSDVFWTWILWLLAAFVLGLILGWLLKQIFGSGAAGSDPTQDLTKIEGIGPKIEGLLNKKGIKRYGFFYIPMDECLSRCVLDFSGRPELVWKVRLGLKKIGEMDTELFHEFFKAFANEAKCNLHIENLYGKNNHHIIESCFKSFARSVRNALTIDVRIKNIIPSSKGTL